MTALTIAAGSVSISLMNLLRSIHRDRKVEEEQRVVGLT